MFILVELFNIRANIKPDIYIHVFTTIHNSTLNFDKARACFRGMKSCRILSLNYNSSLGQPQSCYIISFTKSGSLSMVSHLFLCARTSAAPILRALLPCSYSLPRSSSVCATSSDSPSTKLTHTNVKNPFTMAVKINGLRW